MDENPIPPIFPWILRNWLWLSVIGAGIAAGMVAWVKFNILIPLEKQCIQLHRIQRIIPVEAIEKNHMLQTIDLCSQERNSCGIHDAVTDLGNHIKKILEVQTGDTKKLVSAVTTLINRLPLESKDREDVFKALIE